jgi:hypothetical protein
MQGIEHKSPSRLKTTARDFEFDPGGWVPIAVLYEGF